MAAFASTGVIASPTPQGKVDARGSDVTAILVDVVVRDKNGNPVADVRQDEFELSEDGQKQDIGSFTPIFKDAAALSLPNCLRRFPDARSPPLAPRRRGRAAVAAAANATDEVLAIVFDRLSPEPRELAHRAALAYVGVGARTNKLMAVYGIDLGLVPYQWFTRDAGSVRRAVDEFGNRSTSQFGSTREQRMDTQLRASQAGQAVSSAEAAAAGGGPGAGAAADAMAGAAGDAQFQQMQQQMLQTFDSLERDQRGYSTANALMAVVSSMRGLPGRKAIVFFSEGLSIPPNAQERFVAVVAAANRANVSVYSVDSAGLRTESTSKETREEMHGRSPAWRFAIRQGCDRRADVQRSSGMRTDLRLDLHSGLGDGRRSDQAVWCRTPTTTGGGWRGWTAIFATTTCSATCHRMASSTDASGKSSSR